MAYLAADKQKSAIYLGVYVCFGEKVSIAMTQKFCDLHI